MATNNQPTRSVQTFEMEAPLIAQRHDRKINEISWSDPDDDFLPRTAAWDAFLRLYRSTNSSPNDNNVSIPANFQPTGRPPRSVIERLPNELIAMILQRPELIRKDIIAFGLSSRNLLAHSFAAVARQMRQGDWVNTPLICLGSDARDLPLPLQTHYSRDEDATGALDRSPRRIENNVFPARLLSGDSREPRAGIPHCRPTDPHSDRQKRWRDSFEFAGYGSGIPYPTLKKLSESFRQLAEIRIATELDMPWFLRNLDTNQFVALRVVLSDDRKAHRVVVLGAPWLSLDTALFLRVLWSSEPPLSPSPDGLRFKALRRGVWAGHRFDVIDDERVASAPGWVDVTAELISDAEWWRARSPLARWLSRIL